MPLSRGAKKRRAQAIAAAYRRFKGIPESEKDPETWPKYKDAGGNYIPLTTNKARTDVELETREKRLRGFKPSGKFPWRD